jgi:hypothetical protein
MHTLIIMEINNLVEGMDINGNHDLNLCDECVYGHKQHHTPFPLSGGSCVKEIIGFVHTNLCGPMETIHGE